MRLHNRQIKAAFWNDPEILQWPRDKRWFYEGLIQLADDSGCLEDSPFAFKLNLFPSPVDADITVEMLAQWRDELIEAEKLVRYRVGKKSFLYLTNFHKHQSLKNPEKPEVPLPPWVRWETYESNNRAGKYIVSEDVLTSFLRGTYDVLPIEIEGEVEEKGREENTPTTTANAHAREETDERAAEVFRTFEREGFGTLSSFLVDELNDMVETYSAEWVIRAMHEAVRSGKRNLKYVGAILKRWKAEGVDTPWEVTKDAKPRGSPQRRMGEFDHLSL